MKIEKELTNQIENLKGKLLVIGTFSDKIIDSIEANENIIFCDILSNNNNSDSTDTKSKNNSYIKVEELKKKYKKKKITDIICDYNDVEICFPIFFKDVFSIFNNNLYLYIKKDKSTNLEKNLNKLSINYEKKEDSNYFLYIIKNKKISIIKSNLIYLQNKLEVIIEMLSNIMEG